jgi:hypothetical protein
MGFREVTELRAVVMKKQSKEDFLDYVFARVCMMYQHLMQNKPTRNRIICTLNTSSRLQ